MTLTIEIHLDAARFDADASLNRDTYVNPEAVAEAVRDVAEVLAARETLAWGDSSGTSPRQHFSPDLRNAAWSVK